MNITQEFPIQTFNFENNTIRTIDVEGVIWFVAKDVATALGYANTAQAVTVHCRKAKSLIDIRCYPVDVSNTNTGSPLSPENQMKMILESDVYRLTLKSTLPSAEKFQDWIVEEVLPAIRKTGTFNMVPVNSQNQDLINTLVELQSKSLELQTKSMERENMFLDLQSKSAEREAQYLELISKFNERVEYEKYKASITSIFEITNKIEFEKYVNIIKELANISVRANFNEVTLKLYLYQSVKEHEKIFKSNGLPYEKYINNGFYVVENGEVSKVYITRRGSDHLFWFLKSKNLILGF